ncbi:MAG: flavodoxin family protein [Clostridiales bacterium]|nr:flavodoxin family protein [Clostridiales bacterium]
MKKTLIIHGSPRKNGETAKMVNWIAQRLEGEVRMVSSYRADIHPCVDCRYCWKHPGCCRKDEMQEIYSYLEECDNLLFASPIYFSELTGSFLNLASRFQPYFCSKFYRKETPSMKEKKGALVIAYGGEARDWEKPYSTASMLFELLQTKEILPLVRAEHTDEILALEQPETVRGLEKIVEAFNKE